VTAADIQPAVLPPRPLPILTRPWFWIVLMALLCSVPLIKSLGAELPEPLPGWETLPLDLALDDVDGRPFDLADLAGHLVVIAELPLANGEVRDWTFSALRRLRKRMRGLGSAVVYVALGHGADRQSLATLVDERTARKPVNVFLFDPDHREMDRLRADVGGQSADFLLLDRHGRARGLYATPRVEPGMSDEQLSAARSDLDRVFDALVADAGQLANWARSDPEPGQPIER
jgi:hypothetical protein